MKLIRYVTTLAVLLTLVAAPVQASADTRPVQVFGNAEAGYRIVGTSDDETIDLCPDGDGDWIVTRTVGDATQTATLPGSSGANITVNARGGANTISVGCQTEGDVGALRVKTTSGIDTIRIGGIRETVSPFGVLGAVTADSVAVNTGSGADEVVFDAVTVSGDVSVRTRKGSDEVTFKKVELGSLGVWTDNDGDIVQASRDANLGLDPYINTGRGSDYIALAVNQSTATGVLSIRSGDDRDGVEVSYASERVPTLPFLGSGPYAYNLDIRTGNGNDLVYETLIGKAGDIVNGGSGDDELRYCDLHPNGSYGGFEDRLLAQSC